MKLRILNLESIIFLNSFSFFFSLSLISNAHRQLLPSQVESPQRVFVFLRSKRLTWELWATLFGYLSLHLENDASHKKVSSRDINNHIVHSSPIHHLLFLYLQTFYLGYDPYLNYFISHVLWMNTKAAAKSEWFRISMAFNNFEAKILLMDVFKKKSIFSCTIHSKLGYFWKGYSLIFLFSFTFHLWIVLFLFLKPT